MKLNLFLISALSILAVACSANPAPLAPMPISADMPFASVVVHPEKPGRTIPQDFIGLSYETPDLIRGQFEDTASIFARLIDDRSSTLARMLGTLGRGVLRFGGSSLDRHTYWSRTTRILRSNPDVTVTAPDLDQLFAFARSAGWQVILGLPLGHYDPQAAADEAEYAVTHGGATLLALEIGNEPDLYAENGVRTPQYDYGDFRAEFEAYVNAIRARVPNAPIVGPNTCCQRGLEWFPRFIADEGSQLIFVTQHIYPMWNDPRSLPGSVTDPSLDNMLSPQLMRHTAETVDVVERAVQPRHLPVRIDESNAVSAGVKTGVSDTFAAALWAADHAFTLLEHNASGVNFHDGGFSCGAGSAAPVCGTDSGYVAQPIYYGMLLFSFTAHGRVAPVNIDSPVNLTAHAALGDDGKLRLALINKDKTQTVAVQINTGKPYSNAGAMRLLAPSIEAINQITFGGQGIKMDGSWSPTTIEPIMRNGTMFQIAVPAASAVVVTFE